jgi:hypothetical protein
MARNGVAAKEHCDYGFASMAAILSLSNSQLTSIQREPPLPLHQISVQHIRYLQNPHT